MATRPWVTPQEVVNYTDIPAVQTRDEAKLAVDIQRAEAKVIAYCHHDFTETKEDGSEVYTAIPDAVKTAVILLAEAYAKNTLLKSTTQYTSETHDDYSYTIKDGEITIESLNITDLLDPYVDSSGSVIFHMHVV